MEMSLSKEAAGLVTGTIERRLEELFCQTEDLRRAFAPLLMNRYQGYLSAMNDTSNEGGPVFNTGKYFVACCRQGDRYVDYERLIPDPEDLEELGDMVNPEGLRALKELKARGEHATYPLGMEVIQISGLLGSYASGLQHGIDCLMQQHG